jgi:hypothetical protein
MSMPYRPEATGQKIVTTGGLSEAPDLKTGPPGKTIAQFCLHWRISKRTFHRWKLAGIGPVVIQPFGPGGRSIITPDNEAAWARAHARLAAVIAAA